MTSRVQHKAVYNVPSGDESGFTRIEVTAPFGMSVDQLRKSVETFLSDRPGAQLLSRTWKDE